MHAHTDRNKNVAHRQHSFPNPIHSRQAQSPLNLPALLLHMLPENTTIPIPNTSASAILGKLEEVPKPHNPQLPPPTAAATQPGGNIVQQILAESSHPTALVFHVLFRTLALVAYLFLGLFGGNGFILTFVLITLLSAADFWTVKNVTGRLLVGLRWWSEPRPDGSTMWIYESKDVCVPQAIDV